MPPRAPGVVLLSALLAGLGPVGGAQASQSACEFGDSQAGSYEIELIGYEWPQVIVFSSLATGGRRITLPAAHYTLRRFDPRRGEVLLEFRNPGSPALPPSFTLSAAGDRGVLRIASAAVRGRMHCGS